MHLLVTLGALPSYESVFVLYASVLLLRCTSTRRMKPQPSTFCVRQRPAHRRQCYTHCLLDMFGKKPMHHIASFPQRHMMGGSLFASCRDDDSAWLASCGRVQLAFAPRCISTLNHMACVLSGIARAAAPRSVSSVASAENPVVCLHVIHVCSVYDCSVHV